MVKLILRNLVRTLILILAVGLVIGGIYALSFTSLGAAPNQGEFPGGGQGAGQYQTLLEGTGSQAGQGGGLGQGNGFGGGHHGGGQGLGLGQGRGEQFSLEQGLPELGKSLLVITVVSFLQYLAKRRQRVSTAT
jgi:hypothetical protein